MGKFELIETVTQRGCCRPVPLDQLVQLLMGSALDAAIDRKTKFTDTERERLHRQSSILSSAVAELIKVLADHRHAHVREHRLATLFEALGSTTIIASHVIDNPTIERLRTAAANDVRSARPEETKRIITDQMAQRGWTGPINKAAAELLKDEVCKQTGQKLKAGTIQKYERALRKTD
jgi:hypothetical protein